MSDRTPVRSGARDRLLREVCPYEAVVGAFQWDCIVRSTESPNYQPQGPNYHPDHPTTPQGPKSAPKGKAYGYYCRGESKKHVKGVKGTVFSNCVKALAQADKNDNLTAKKACKAQKNAAGKHKPHGEKGTAFSRCIKAVNQMRREQHATLATASSVA